MSLIHTLQHRSYGIERHLYAPELNKLLVVINEEEIYLSVPQCTCTNDAIKYLTHPTRVEATCKKLGLKND